jgi:MSHA biogenesis protein MshP
VIAPAREQARAVRHRRQRGFSLIAAIFLIVVLAALAAFAVQVAVSQNEGGDLELLEARTQAAADAGIEYAANRALNGAKVCAASRTLSLNVAGLEGYSVTVKCSATSGHWIETPPPAANDTDYVLKATATHGTYGQPGYVSRTVARTVTNAPP